MRTYVAICSIICGTVLATAPAVSEYLQSRQVSEYLAESPETNPTPFFRQPIAEEYTVGSWLLGGSMIALGILGGSGRRASGIARVQPWAAVEMPARGDN